MATEPQRAHMAGVMDWMVANEPRIHYLQRRPMLSLHLREQTLAHLFTKGESISMDCSEAVVLICKYAGLLSPVGDYSGSGNTQTMLGHLPHYTDPKAADIGAIVIFGPHNDAKKQHACIVAHPGADPLLFSHGQEKGPLYIRLSAEKAAHAPPVTFLSIRNL